MTKVQLRASLALWKRRAAFRQDRHRAAQDALNRAREQNIHPRQPLEDRRDHWSRLLKEARANIDRRERQLAEVSGPRIVSAHSIGLTFQNLFGSLGAETNVTGHYSAGPRARDTQEGISRARSFHAQHKSQGWGGCGYHFIIADDGTIICTRPTTLKGAHVGGHNSNNLGINMPGTVGDEPTSAQRASYKWLLSNAHTSRLPKAHRTDRKLRQAKRWGHRDWAGHHSNQCPGAFYSMYHAG